MHVQKLPRREIDHFLVYMGNAEAILFCAPTHRRLGPRGIAERPANPQPANSRQQQVLSMMFLVLALLLLISIIFLTVTLQYRRSLREYKRLAEGLCDPGSWSVKFLVRMVILVGKVDGLPIRYSVLGSPHGERLAASYLLLPCPVKRNLRVYAESDLSRVEGVIREGLEVLQEIEGFRSVIFTPAASHFLGKLLSRPLGFGYEPGILLGRLGEGAFDPGVVKENLAHLVALCKKSV